ncbi:HNH endonuclease signature motif containing protein [Streptomyces collinus]|uniref:HNH endonuclease n=1 Tax=Streptomyces collinus TaxID=42684 RepID=UPI0033DDB5B4
MPTTHPSDSRRFFALKSWAYTLGFKRQEATPVQGRVWIRIGREEYPLGIVSEEAYLKEKQQQRHEPILMMAIEDRRYWWFQDRFYWENDNMDGDDVHALLLTRHQRERQRVDRPRAMVAMGKEPRIRERVHIPDDVKQLVWIRDQGRCRVCGATSELQFDHIIPVAMGGSSEVDNLQLLCGACNRRKGAGLTSP